MSLRTSTVLTLSLLCGCSTPPVADRTLLDPPPANLLVRCPPPEQLQESKPLLTGEMAEADVDLAYLYHECAARQQALVRWVGEAVERLRR